MADHIDLLRSSVLQHCLEESSHGLDVLLSVIVLIGKIGIGWAPGSCVKLSLDVALASEVGEEFSCSGLPRSVAVGAASSKGEIAVSVDEDHWYFCEFFFGRGFSPECCTLEISPFKSPTRVTLIFYFLPFLLRKEAKSYVNPQVMSKALTCCSTEPFVLI